MLIFLRNAIEFAIIVGEISIFMQIFPYIQIHLQLSWKFTATSLLFLHKKKTKAFNRCVQHVKYRSIWHVLCIYSSTDRKFSREKNTTTLISFENVGCGISDGSVDSRSLTKVIKTLRKPFFDVINTLVINLFQVINHLKINFNDHYFSLAMKRFHWIQMILWKVDFCI